MKRHAQRPQPGNHSASQARTANHSRALVHVDGTAIRKKIKKDYDKALRDLENSRRQLDQFHQTDQPQFTRWLNSHFGALLTELRELSQKLAADQELIFQVESETMFSGCSDVRAYQRVMELRENPEAPQPHPPGSGETDGERDPFGARAEAGTDDDNEEDPIEEFMNAFFGQFGPGAGPQDHYGPRRGLPRESAAPAQGAARLKELYRSVVRRLHPDIQGEMTPQKTEWWHQAQAAYEAGDVEQLEVILTLCEIGDSGTTAHTSASLLQRITAQLKHSIQEIKRQLAGLRRDPAWNFSRRADHDVLALQMRRGLTGDLERMRHQWRTIQEMIARWKVAAERLKKPRRRKNRPQNSEFSGYF
jgi:hypothetical protein